MTRAFPAAVALALCATLTLGLSAPQAAAADVTERLQPAALSFTGGASFTNARLQVVGPDDFEAEETASRGLPVFRVRGGQLQDGVYRYYLSAATDEQVPRTRAIDNGRGDAARDFSFVPFYKEGMFRVTRGLIEPIEGGSGGQDEG